jgi:hypothetical protein
VIDGLQAPPVFAVRWLDAGLRTAGLLAVGLLGAGFSACGDIDRRRPNKGLAVPDLYGKPVTVFDGVVVLESVRETGEVAVAIKSAGDS